VAPCRYILSKGKSRKRHKHNFVVKAERERGISSALEGRGGKRLYRPLMEGDMGVAQLYTRAEKGSTGVPENRTVGLNAGKKEGCRGGEKKTMDSDLTR